ncbi:MAG: hypothetical protein ABJA84_03690, partial [Polaromonas sp.]
ALAPARRPCIDWVTAGFRVIAVLQARARASLESNKQKGCEFAHFHALNRMLLRGTAWGTGTPEKKP